MPLWVSVGGFSAARLRRDLRAARRRRRRLELNLSCPNVDEAPESAAEIVAACRAATDAAALREALAGRVGHRRGRARGRGGGRRRALAREHDPRARARRARCSRGSPAATGGYSGPALKPIALAAVYACRRATALPIVGMGGVATGRDALELVACGATHVALGTVLFADPDAPGRVRPSSPTSSRRAGFDCGRRAPVGAAHDSVVRLETGADDAACTAAARLLVCGAHGAAPDRRYKLPSGRSTSGWRHSNGRTTSASSAHS